MRRLRQRVAVRQLQVSELELLRVLHRPEVRQRWEPPARETQQQPQQATES